MIITKLEEEMIRNIGDSDYNDGDPRSATWTNVVVETNQGKGVLSSLIKKGLAVVRGNGKDSTVELTDEGRWYFRRDNPDHWYTKKYDQLNKEQEIAERRLPNC
jgi:hypothetical protein